MHDSRTWRQRTGVKTRSPPPHPTSLQTRCWRQFPVESYLKDIFAFRNGIRNVPEKDELKCEALYLHSVQTLYFMYTLHG